MASSISEIITLELPIEKLYICCVCIIRKVEAHNSLVNRIEYNKIDSSIRRTLPANLYKFYKMERPSNIIPGELLSDVFQTFNTSIGLTILKSRALLVRVVEYMVFEILTAAYDRAYDKARYSESDISSIVVSLSDVTNVIKEVQDFNEFFD